MGLCGSLSPQYAIGDTVLYESCVYPVFPLKDRSPQLPREKIAQQHLASPFLRGTGGGSLKEATCDPALTVWVHHQLKERVYRVKALTSDRLIYSAHEKRQLGQRYEADVVDMEGVAALEVLSRFGVAVAMLRVISDDCHHDIPDLTAAINSDGSLRSVPLAIALLRQPIAATQLISGALGGLQALQEVTTVLFTK